MSYFVTGATGFIGRFLVPELLEREGDVHVLVRAGSEGKLARIAEGWGAGAAARVKPVAGNLGEEALGIDPAWIEEHAGTIDHVFHLAAVYDMAASEEQNELMNNGGTRHAVQVANALQAGHLHHTSSVAAAGLYEGTFTEAMFDEGQPLDHPYHRTKFESERIAREESEVPWRVYRPAIVVGNSKTGEMDKIDGPYYFFPAIKAASLLPEQLPMIVPRLGQTNIVPVDFVAEAMAYLAHAEGLDGRAFHLVDPEPTPTIDVLNTFAGIAGAPRMHELLPSGSIGLVRHIPGVEMTLERLGIPPSTLDYTGFTCTFDATQTTKALQGSGIAVPPLEDYAQRLWNYWQEHLR